MGEKSSFLQLLRFRASRTVDACRKGAVRRLRKTQPRRCSLPDFIIVGAMKAGTPCQHPQIIGTTRKEVRFFDQNYQNGETWYRSFFPHEVEKTIQHIQGQGRILTGEASPSYIFYPRAVSRMCRLLSEVKIIILLRDPVKRAFSHYQHNVRKGREPLSFEAALEAEDQRIQADPTYVSYEYLHYSYRRKGYYIDQSLELEEWISRENICVVTSDDFFGNERETVDRILRFLDLDSFSLRNTTSVNRAHYTRQKTPTHNDLKELFRPHNEKLYKMVGRDFGWN